MATPRMRSGLFIEHLSDAYGYATAFSQYSQKTSCISTITYEGHSVSTHLAAQQVIPRSPTLVPRYVNSTERGSNKPKK